MAEVQGPGPDRPKGNVFTNKVGPLPLYGWLAIATVLAIIFVMMRKKNSSNSNSSTVDSPGGVDASLVPQFVNQTYVNTEPPEQPPHKPSHHGHVKTTVQAYSWTDNGQKWSVNELAKKLGISPKALKAGNAEAKKALANPNAPMPKGAHFTYVKEPKGITTSNTNDALWLIWEHWERPKVRLNSWSLLVSYSRLLRRPVLLRRQPKSTQTSARIPL